MTEQEYTVWDTILTHVFNYTITGTSIGIRLGRIPQILREVEF